MSQTATLTKAENVETLLHTEKQSGYTRPAQLTTYGYKFRVTEDHYTEEELKPMLQNYDVIGTEALSALDELFPPPPPRAGWYAKSKSEDAQPDRDTYALLRDNRGRDSRLQKLWDQVNDVPEWVDWEQIKRGQETFYRYAPGAVAGFAFQGLLASTVCLHSIARV